MSLIVCLIVYERVVRDIVRVRESLRERGRGEERREGELDCEFQDNTVGVIRSNFIAVGV